MAEEKKTEGFFKRFSRGKKTINAKGDVVDKSKTVKGEEILKGVSGVSKIISDAIPVPENQSDKGGFIGTLAAGKKALNVIGMGEKIYKNIDGMNRTDSGKGKSQDNMLDGDKKDIAAATPKEKVVALVITLSIVSVLVILIYEYATPVKKE